MLFITTEPQCFFSHQLHTAGYASPSCAATQLPGKLIQPRGLPDRFAAPNEKVVVVVVVVVVVIVVVVGEAAV